ncbi:PEP/pyruvate-binding domain-containing protein [Haladaptatus sp. AB643]|uniref:PEP/pyruvate-binding domain-containing protein n=1 Tax=Haladaptatus sp. AB643 TaxID=2934174 RepID=UPI00209C0207|nr:PEP/pyruvate-binding domain-containing protein [Haladaptatus sp. AB643]MCO8244190.1 PEP-utilizing enzyme [Haladaptatus sp. AB643]
MDHSQADSDSAVFTLPFDDGSAIDASVTGGKGANLALLVDAGIDVPAGFCVTTGAYRSLVTAPETRRAIEAVDELDPTDADRIAELSATIRERIREAEFPTDVRKALDDSLVELDAETVSVRSSATAEDLPTASFAGQHETYLNVSSEAVLDRVRDCMASLYTDRAVTYRLRNDVPSSGVALAVVVQAMVDADTAGVVFTADPITENRTVATIEANYGLGESIVAGEVSADTIRVDRSDGTVLSYDIGEKSVRVRSGNEGGIERATVSDDSRGRRALSPEQVHRLVEQGEKIEGLFDEPQDIEWAFRDGELFVLQSRPITSLFPLVSPQPEDGLLHVYMSFGHQQAMPEALPPLVVDFWRSFIDGGAARFRPPEAGGLSAEAGNRVYVDLTPLVRLAPLRQRIPNALSFLSEPASDGLREVLRKREDDIPERGVGAGWVRILQAIRRGKPSLLPIVSEALSEFVHSLVFGVPDLDELWAWSDSWGTERASELRSPQTTDGRVRAIFEEVDIVAFLRYIAPKGATALPGVLAGRLLRRTFPDATDELDAIGKGFEDEVVTRMNVELGELATLAGNAPEVKTALNSGASLDEIATLRGGEVFVETFDSFIDRFGHRATGEIDLRRPRWRDDPSVLLSTIRNNVGEERGSREHLAELQRRAATAQRRLEARANHGLLGPIRKLAVRHLIRSYRKAMPFREFPKHGMARVFAAVHEICSEVGETLAERGSLERPDDVWFLRRDELLATLDGVPLDVDVESRRRTHERYAKMTAPPLLTSEGEQPTAAPNRDVEEGTLVGTAVSAGVIEGTARVVRDPSEGSLEPGEILVAPSTDPGWTPLFLNAAGLVMEVGGRMTHGALVAREYGIPAVASVTNATTEIHTGDRIRVDGKNGTVERL